MSNIEEAPAPVSVKAVGVLEKFDGEGTDPENLVERVHAEETDDGQWKVVKVEYFEGADNKLGEKIVEEGGTN